MSINSQTGNRTLGRSMFYVSPATLWPPVVWKVSVKVFSDGINVALSRLVVRPITIPNMGGPCLISRRSSEQRSPREGMVA